MFWVSSSGRDDGTDSNEIVDGEGLRLGKYRTEFAT